jgi:uncharacterized protein (DUF2147 family)
MAAPLFRSQVSLAVALCACAAASIGAAVSGVADDAAVGQQAANPADQIVGDWRPADMPDADIRIFPAKGKYVGGVVKAANQALVNTEMLREIEYVPATRTWKGEVFALKRGMFVPMTIRLTNAGFEMVAGSGLLTKTIEWKRVVAESSSAGQ